MEGLELTIFVKPHKHLEFKQTLDNLFSTLQKHCTSLKINDSENGLPFSILAQWETAGNMHDALNKDEFKILFGAIEALCEKVQIRLNDKLVGNHISMLANIKKTNSKYSTS